ncbi:MAG TPA: carboxypeptidase-like regulatory domain-containing protein [Silvibacterium sp.]|nr:carboxypeptidase-like regulatory domain-containing protein [Silvibacterium sp.]
MTHKWYRLPLLSFVFVLACSGVYAQSNSTITGTVVDKEGAAVAGAALTLTNPATGTSVTTDSNGSGVFTFPGLNVGVYDLKATAKGFETYVQTGLQVNVSQTLNTQVMLTVGAVNETVTVAAQALQVQTDSNVVSTLISGQQIEKIATENRNFAALAALGMGVSSALPDSNTPTSVAANFTLSVNGLRQSHNIWLIDGGEADDRGGAGGMSIMPSQDAMAQFEVLASNYPPDYGISSGATVSLGLKSGTQKFHGSAWEFNRNTDYNANNYFNKHTTGTPQPRTKLNYNIFGFNIGGPVFIPHVYNTDKQKTFFFWNEEWRKLIQGSAPATKNTLPAEDFPVAGQDLHYVSPAFATVNLKVPNITAAQNPAYAAKLASYGLTPGGTFPGNVIPAGLFDPNALLYFNSGIIPKPTQANGQAVVSANQPIDVRDDIGRFDHNFNDRWRLLAHYLHDSVTQTYSAPMLGWSGADYTSITSVLSNPSNSAAVKLTASLNPSLLVEASFNWDGNIIDIANSPNSFTPSGWSVNRYFVNNSKNLPNMHWGAPYNTQENPGSAPWHNAAQDYQPRVDVSWTKGKHAMKYGFSYMRYVKNQQLFGQPGGQFYWQANQTNDAMMDMLLGLSSGYDQTQVLNINHYANTTVSFWGDDNWKINPRLSVQVGFRYDALPHAWERNNQIANFNPALYNPSLAPQWNTNAKGVEDGSMNPNGPGFSTPAGFTHPFYLNGIYIGGENGYPHGLVNNYWKTFQPRVGFSYDLFGNGRTVLRGGFGTFYERLQGNDIYNAGTNPPFYYDPSAGNVFLSDPHTSWASGQTASTPTFPQGMTTLKTYYPAPGVAQFSLGIQHEIMPSVIWIVQYVGNVAWSQNVDRNINTFPLSTAANIRANDGDPNNNSGTNPGGSSLANVNHWRTFPGFAGVNQQENSTNGSYHGFQTGVRLSNKWGLSGEVDYTWSHEIDITSYDLAGLSNPFNQMYDYGSGALDRRHILVANYVYQLPFFKGSQGLTHTFLGGWELAGTFVAESGYLGAVNNQGVNLQINYDPVGLGGGYTNRPNASARPRYPKKVDHWFDSSVFSNPTPAWAGGPNQGFGSARKDIAIGPGRENFTTALYKTFDIKEVCHFELRFESFNTFNHTEFQNVNSGFGSGNFGAINSTWDPRNLELGGKFVF